MITFMSFAATVTEPPDVELSTTQVANLIGVDRSAVYDWAVAGRIQSRRDEQRRLWIRASDLQLLRQMCPGAKPCPDCQLLARLLLQWGDTSRADLAAVSECDVPAHLQDLVVHGLAENVSGEIWRLTPMGTRFADGREMPATVPLAVDSRARAVEDLPHFEDYLELTAVIAEHGPISAAAAGERAELDRTKALRRARRLERARLVYRPRPRLWAITPKGREWLDKHRPAAPDAPPAAIPTSSMPASSIPASSIPTS